MCPPRCAKPPRRPRCQGAKKRPVPSSWDEALHDAGKQLPPAYQAPRYTTQLRLPVPHRPHGQRASARLYSADHITAVVPAAPTCSSAMSHVVLRFTLHGERSALPRRFRGHESDAESRSGRGSGVIFTRVRTRASQLPPALSGAQ